jgi:predicted ATPase with chaperone activity
VFVGSIPRALAHRNLPGLVEGATVIPVRTLADLSAHLTGERPLAPYLGEAAATDDEVLYPVDFQDIKGQEHVKRALEVAAAGAHNLLKCGPPGAGKTLMARAVPSILPPIITLCDTPQNSAMPETPVTYTTHVRPHCWG